MVSSATAKPRKQQYTNVPSSGQVASEEDEENEDNSGHEDPLRVAAARFSDQPQPEDMTAISNSDLAVATVEMSVDDAIDRLGMGLFQYRILIAAGLCFAADAMEVLLLSFLSIVLQHEWNLTDDETAFITSTLFAGALVGTSILGPLADKWGRRPVFILAATMIAIFGVGTSLANNYEQILAIMFIVGFGVGGLTVPFDTLAEFLPSEGRGTNLLLIEYFWTIGCLLVIVFAELTLAHGKSNWRLFVILCALPCFVSIVIGWLYVPESVRWLVSEGRNDEALGILREAARVNKLTAATPLTQGDDNSRGDNSHHDGDDVDLIFPLNTQLVSEEDHSAENSASCSDLLKPQWRGTMIKLWGAWGGFGIAYYGSILSITKIFDDQAAPTNSTIAFASNNTTSLFATEGATQSTDFDYSAIFISSSAELLGTTFVIIMVDRVGRIPSQVVSYAAAGVCIFLMCTLADSSDAAASERWELVGLGFLLRAFDMAATCTSWVMTAEVLSTEIRTTGHASANAVARLGAFFSPFLVNILDLRSLGIVMLAVHWFTAACVSQLPETKGGQMGGGGHATSEIVGASSADEIEGSNGDTNGRSGLVQSEEKDEHDEPDGLFVIDDGGVEFTGASVDSTNQVSPGGELT